MSRTPAFTFDAPTGTYRSEPLSKALRELADRVGPVLPLYAPVRYGSLDALRIDSDAAKVLLYQLRYLRRLFPEARPELRVSVPADFGRSCAVCWYAPEYECIISEVVELPIPLDPKEVL